MKILLISAAAVLSLLFAARKEVGPPVPGLDAPWSATAPIHSPK
ncbi:hypothetical protein BH10PSE4_BH10PSE4_22210 [soil metagenome]